MAHSLDGYYKIRDINIPNLSDLSTYPLSNFVARSQNATRDFISYFKV